MPDELLRPTIGADVDISARPWRLMSQAYIAFFGGVVATTVIAVLNARRLGVPVKGQRLIALSGLGGLVLAAVALRLLTDEVSATSGTRVAIRVIAVLHYIGAAFEPEHMRTLANIAADALDDRPIPAPPDPEEISERAREWADKYGAWVE